MPLSFRCPACSAPMEVHFAAPDSTVRCRSCRSDVTAPGTVVAWGYDAAGQTQVPDGLAEVIAVSAGWAYNLALRADGAVVGWGANDSGQLAVPAGAGESEHDRGDPPTQEDGAPPRSPPVDRHERLRAVVARTSRPGG